jgi:uncharacterized damage-inducible protein DinB
MFIEVLRTSYKKDLEKLKQEIVAFSNEKLIWKTESGINNSSGNLCLHLVGNLNHFIGALLGNSGYVRNRDQEFSLKDVPRDELIKKIENTIEVVDNTLATLRDEDLEKEFPVALFDRKDTCAFILTHLTTHLSYHLGQINYHRRLLDK